MNLFISDLPQIIVRNDKSLDSIPQINIIFPNGHEDSLVLQRFYASPEARISGDNHCNYFGHLLIDQTACVSVTGCYGQDNLEFTINSKHTGTNNMYILETDGNLKAVESTFKVIIWTDDILLYSLRVCVNE